MLPVLFAVALLIIAPFSQADNTAAAVSYHLSFESFGFLDEDYIARSGTKSIADRGLTLVEGRFGRGLKMNRVPDEVTGDNLHTVLLDPVTRVKYSSESGANRDNEPYLWGAGKLNPAAGAVAFWIKGALGEGELFNQSAIDWGRKEQYLLAVTVDKAGHPGAYLRDARYVYHRIQSDESLNGETWNHVVLNWDRSQGLELFVNGVSIVSSWGTDSWWETALPGLLHLPMPRVVYDEFYIFSRPLAPGEISSLRESNTPPAAGRESLERTVSQRDRLAKALGISTASKLPALTPITDGRVLSFREITPAHMGDGHVPGRFCMDGRYELAWPHPIGVFTWVPGDADFQAEKLDIEAPPGTPWNYITVEGNLDGMPSILTGCRKEGDRFTGGIFLDIPQDGRFFFGGLVDRETHPRITLPFLKGYGAPGEYTGDVRLPITGATRIHEVGLFDVREIPCDPVPGEMAFFLYPGGGRLDKRCDFALRALNPLVDRTVVSAYKAPPDGQGEWMSTGYLGKTHIVTAPLSGETCIGGILFDCTILTEDPEDVLLLRLRNPGLPHQTWTHAEVKIEGFDGDGGRLRILLDHTPLLCAAGDVIWLEIATLNDARIKIGGAETARLVLRPAPVFGSERPYELKALMPAMAEYMKAPHHLPWMFDKDFSDVLDPHVFGGHYDSLLPAQAVKRVLPHSRLADFYIEYCMPRRKWAYLWMQENSFPVKNIEIPDAIPRWAYLQHRIQHFRYDVAAWIVANQNPDGQFGGGMNDDILIFRDKFDMPLDGCDYVRDSYLKVYEALDDTRMFAGGYCGILPTDTGHVDDLVRYRFYTLVYKLGDPFIYRRSMETAWHWNKPERTPLNYRNGSSFLFDKDILEWYWGKKKPVSAYTTAHPDTLNEKMTRLVSYLDDLMYYRFTEARTHTDRQAIDYEHLVEGMIVGGWGKYVNQDDLSMSIAWPEGGGEDLARWITYADHERLECRMYSFDPLPRKVTARLFRIEPGIYEIALREDNGGPPGKALSSTKKTMRRFDTFSVTVQPGQSVVLSVRRIEAIDEPSALPDLAVASYDCKRTGTRLTVRVSNLGAAPSKPSVLRVFDNRGLKIAEKPVSAVDAPLDFVEKSVLVEFAGVPGDGIIRVAVDPDNVQIEIFEENNETVIP